MRPNDREEHELWLCDDCTIVEVNGDYSGMDDERAEEVARGIEALVSKVGHLAANWDSETDEGIRDFSRSRCDACGSTLGGGRHRFAAFGYEANGGGGRKGLSRSHTDEAETIIYQAAREKFGRRIVLSWWPAGNRWLLTDHGPGASGHQYEVVDLDPEVHDSPVRFQRLPHTPNEDQTWREHYGRGYREAEARGLEPWKAREEAAHAAWSDYEARAGRKPFERNSSGYYVWVLARSGEPIEGPFGPHDLEGAKTFARIGATEGNHDRAVSLGIDPQAPSFRIVRAYKATTGERLL